MAEKEKRILIGTDIESPCVKCKVELCAEKCEEYEKFAEEFNPGALKVFSRQEAINRMANAINVAYLNRNPDYIVHFGLLAEAALNALLEGK